MAADGENFFSRWSLRKAQVRQGEPVQAGPAPVTPAVPAVPAVQLPPMPASAQEPDAAPPNPALPELTLDDVQALTPDSDFSPFVGRGVLPEVRNAALKKLFADPHFNVMDGLDIYIDDYSQPDPLPLAMARQLVGAQFLKLFDRPAGQDGSKPAAEEDLSEPAPPPDPEPNLPDKS